MIKNWILHIALTITTTSVLAQPLTKNINLIPDSIINEVSSVAQKPDNIIAKSQDSLVAIQSKWLRNIRQSNIPEKQKRLLDSLSKKYNFSADFYAKWDSIGSNINLDQEGIDLDKVDQWVNKYQVKSSKIYTKGENVNPLQEKELAEKLNVFQSEVKQNIPDSTTLSQYKPDNIDQLVEEQALKNEQIQELQKQTGQTGNPTEAFTGKGDKLNQQVEQAQDPAYLRRQSAQKAYMVANDVAGEQMEQLQSAMSSMQKYKKKYFSVDNSADVDAGIEKPKRAEPLTKHWSWGGQFPVRPQQSFGY